MNNMTTLTAEDVASNLAMIENTEATDANVAQASKLLDSCSYTATALCALSIALSEMGDIKGANILLVASLEMARHEATQV